MGTNVVPELFERQAERCPEQVAAISAGHATTYRDLNNRANALAHTLIDGGVGTEQIVAVGLDRSVPMLVAMLAIMKAGAVYLPLDLSYPKERLAHILDRASPAWVITDQENARLIGGAFRTLCLDARDTALRLEQANTANISRCPQSPPLTEAHPAYVIFTSGSSGVPKGVVGLHGGLVNRIEWFQSIRPWISDRPALARTSVGFIDGIVEVLGPLLCGGAVVIAPSSRGGIRRLAELVVTHRVGQMSLVPTLLRECLHDWSSNELKACARWVSSGEHLPKAVAAEFLRLAEGVELLNLYGASEASGDSLWTVCDNEEPVFCSTVRNTQAYVLSDEISLLPFGVDGEIHIAGAGLARGYLNDPATTAVRFIPNPFGEPGSRMFRTGDLGRRRPDGALHLVGRRDRQVKVAGVRVELAEVEAALMESPGVLAAAVSATSAGEDGARIKAYVVTVTEEAASPDTIRRRLRGYLPDEMIPSSIVRLDDLPLLSNGKVDMALLSRMGTPGAPSRAYRAPANEEERVLSEILHEILQVDPVDLDADFLVLGGGSLQALRLVNRLRTRLGVEVEPRSVFEMPNLFEFAAFVAQLRGAR